MPKSPRRWSTEEDKTLKEEVELQQSDNSGEMKDWSSVAQKLPGRSNKDCRKRYYNEVTGGLKKGTWTNEEDKRLTKYFSELGPNWSAVSQKMKNRSADRKFSQRGFCDKLMILECSKRWTHCLDPDIDHSAWTQKEVHGTSWKNIQKIHMPGRSTNNLKNQYNLMQRRRTKLPTSAKPCCSKNGNDSSSSSNNNDSPCGFESLDDTSSIFNTDGDIELGDFTSLDVSSPLSPGFGYHDVDMGNHGNPMSATLSQFSMSDTPGKTPESSNDTYSSNDIVLADLDLDTQYDPSRSRTLSMFHEDNTVDLGAAKFGSDFFDESSLPLSHHEGRPEGYSDPICLDSSTTARNPSGNRTVITLDNIEPENLFAVMNILIKSQANVKMEM